MTARNRLKRVISPGESIQFDGGRIVVRLEERTGRQAALYIEIDSDVKVSPPPFKGPGWKGSPSDPAP